MGPTASSARGRRLVRLFFLGTSPTLPAVGSFSSRPCDRDKSDSVFYALLYVHNVYSFLSKNNSNEILFVDLLSGFSYSKN